MNWLILLYFIELGYSPFYNSMNVLPKTYESIRNENVYYIHLDAEVLILDHFFIGGSTKIFTQSKNKSYKFYPIENDFLFKAGLRFDNIEAGFRHQCNHPVLSNGVQSQGKSYGGYEEFYIRLTNE